MAQYGIFIHRSDSPYDDRPEGRYQFPAQYLSRAKALEGKWILYYGPTKSTSVKGYFALAQVAEIARDERNPGMHIAFIEPRTYLDFPNPVPFQDDGSYFELGLLNEYGAISGRAQQAIRPLEPADFHRIVERALGSGADLLPRQGLAALQPPQFDEQQAEFLYDEPRERTSYLSSRALRDRTFRHLVLDAYDERCAVSGLRLINGGGRAEVEAAHIKPVKANGPDAVTNGLALCGTAHWMFDRGLITIAEDFRILISRQTNDPGGIAGIINRSGRLLLPQRSDARPRRRYLDWHRENCFKQ